MTCLLEVNGKRYDDFKSAARAELNQKSNIEMYNFKGDRVAKPTLADYIIARDRTGIELANTEFARIKEEEENYECDEWFDDFTPGVFFWDREEAVFRRINDKFIKALD